MMDSPLTQAVPARQAQPHSQTLSRGIHTLEILADADAAMSIAELAAALGVHRSIAYRILRTLEDHGLVRRDAAGRIELGPGMAVLARGVSRDLQAAALPELTAVANELAMTAFIAVLDHNQCVTLVTVEPRRAHASVAQHPGTRHPLATGAPGIAIQSALTEVQWRATGAQTPPRAEAIAARDRGYATSHDEVIAGVSAVAVPLTAIGQAPAALAVVYPSHPTDQDAIGHRLGQAAATILNALS
ncbi:MAG: helix-turn-helix domain-containing protein [Microbacteriaceae bacterium]